VGNQQARASARLSSGFRINSAADDAAGLAISEGMRAQIRGLNQASRNAQDGISLVQTAEGVLSTITEMAQRMRELASQGANDTNNAEQRHFIYNEIRQLVQESKRTWDNSTFNGTAIFRQSTPDAPISPPTTGAWLMGATEFTLQIGPDGITGHALDVVAQIGSSAILDIHNRLARELDATSGAFGATVAAAVAADPSLLTHTIFQGVMDDTNSFIDQVSTLRAGLGAIQNRLEFTIESLDIASENLSASESRIRDADMAAEMMRLTQANVLQQAATAMLAQANMAPQSILQLLG
jgi:flagellin